MVSCIDDHITICATAQGWSSTKDAYRYWNKRSITPVASIKNAL
ncbi:hypothetical protein [Nitrosopumilus sp. b3]|nr:hypothetical protein [Nitrosopumilus sp. b3]